MSLPQLPLLEGDDHADIAIIYRYLINLNFAFANATGEAIDPTLGQGGAGSLTIITAPSDITYTPSSSLSVDNTLFGQIDITFTLPERAIGVLILYKEHTESMYHTSVATVSPTSILNLKVGIQYDVKMTGQAANGSIGPFSPTEMVTIPTDALTTAVPTDVAAYARYQSVLFIWTPPVTGTPIKYQIQLANDAAFTVSAEIFTVDTTYFIYDAGLLAEVKYGRVRSVSSASVMSDWSDSATATTVNVPDDSIITVKILDANVTYAKVQDVVESMLLGRGEGAGDGSVEEITLGTGLTLTGTTLSTGAVVASGTYTPTLVNVANLDSSTAFLSQYLQVGNVVTVSGQVYVDCTANATLTQLSLTLPIPSNFAAREQCGGVAFAVGVAGMGAGIYADSVNDVVLMSWISNNVASQEMHFTFTYLIA